MKQSLRGKGFIEDFAMAIDTELKGAEHGKYINRQQNLI